MKLRRHFSGYLELQNMKLQDFVRRGLANRSLSLEDATRLARVEALNVKEMARWDRDLRTAGNDASPSPDGNR
ncbi:hypothetical protein DAH51_19470 [Sphingobium yanoikuyae]|jgi:hypothetical protein|uniref:Uncharacterized protein n=1 Tax=Sphingobium yanoikuyae TaxID=13690 RepID=A0A430BQ98_SPHYA|nr:hypothetical protein DAH51_19470 [Sphingobium yanoikuyae]